MAVQLADRVLETTTTTGTGPLSLDGAKNSQVQTFVAGTDDGAEVYYHIEHQDETTGEWESGIGTVTDAATDTLSRDTVLESSNGGSKESFSAGTKDVYIAPLSSKVVVVDRAQTFAEKQTFDGGADFSSVSPLFSIAAQFDAEILGKEISTPSNPSSGYNKLYFKSDGLLYILDDAGNEQEVTIGESVTEDIFTADGTWNKPDGAKSVLVLAWGGGGGGPASDADSDEGSGGGGGGFKMHAFDADDLGSSETVTVGAGGAGGAAGADNAGSAGENTTFGAHLTAYGGGGGTSGDAGGDGGGGGGTLGAGSTGTAGAGKGGFGGGDSGNVTDAARKSAYGGGGGGHNGQDPGGDSVWGGAGGGGGSAGASVANRAGGTSEFGGDGGDGSGVSGTAGSAGTAPGGGGGSGANSAGGDGARGEVRVYTFS